MRAVRNSPEGVVVEEVDEPEGPVVLSVVAAGVCGTDVSFARGGVDGFTYGHELAGRGEDGRSYAVEPTVRCGRCRQCLAGATQRCTDPGHGNLGVFRDGGMADRVGVEPSMLVELPEGLDAQDACLVEPGAVAWHGLHRAAPMAGERVAVVGGGSIGLLAAALAHGIGLQVDVEARYPHQAAAAEALGAGVAPGADYDVVIDAAGTGSGLARCAELARPGGRVVLLGVYDQTVPVAATPSIVKELSHVSSIAYGRHEGVREVDDVARALAAEPTIARTLITHRFPLDEAAHAFQVAGDRRSGAIKVVLVP